MRRFSANLLSPYTLPLHALHRRRREVGAAGIGGNFPRVLFAYQVFSTSHSMGNMSKNLSIRTCLVCMMYDRLVEDKRLLPYSSVFCTPRNPVPFAENPCTFARSFS